MARHAVFYSGAKLWRSLACAKSELRLDLTLACGQTFRWRETSEGHWTGVMGGRVWTLTQTEDTLWYYVYTNHAGGKNKPEKTDSLRTDEEEAQSVPPTLDAEVEAEMLRDYFQLHVKLGDLYREWGAADCHFKEIADIFTGVRMLRQDPTECLFSFICTSNNHISRIQGMVERLCQALGTRLCQLDQTSYHDFPTLSALADSGVEERLRDLGFGYRARFLQQSAKQILDTHGPQWLDGLRNVLYLEARDALRTLPGVGTKVADCVCLMALDKSEAVPVDTHVWQIAKRDYKFTADNRQKTLTEKVHRDIGDFFRKLWGPYAGWAHSVLFCADLKKFQNLKGDTSLKQSKKEEEREGESKKVKIKRELDGHEKKRKPKAERRKKAKISVKTEEV
ncbi:N-glycosylase/DNA lyase [Fundulus heteroclitus]|uniref:N-glycosylase/DNA lyase n=1 Tax=Fundulus heteroclitus TaxID=8078 RepID=UPI00165CC5FA|nr:N-glycosylase/DNA lyase [Fundulus heteroclitus]XP_035994632.1 N-glycosylase/DNA lyase [Fundulus heteroclitus]XP_035994639.1 N-glycosylase/DNA lyase [Fundulus heteroclitus]XP_035994648.1 N-glycosylase/DNA lyase [Fundulus heteroclitus]